MFITRRLTEKYRSKGKKLHSGSPHPSPFMKERGGGGDWIFELNKIRGEPKFFKINGGRKRERKEEFLKFSLGGGEGGIPGDETSNRKQNFRII